MYVFMYCTYECMLLCSYLMVCIYFPSFSYSCSSPSTSQLPSHTPSPSPHRHAASPLLPLQRVYWYFADTYRQWWGLLWRRLLSVLPHHTALRALANTRGLWWSPLEGRCGDCYDGMRDVVGLWCPPEGCGSVTRGVVTLWSFSWWLCCCHETCGEAMVMAFKVWECRMGRGGTVVVARWLWKNSDCDRAVKGRNKSLFLGSEGPGRVSKHRYLWASSVAGITFRLPSISPQVSPSRPQRVKTKIYDSLEILS